jgi:Ca2+/Na+ antiporter
MNWKVLLFNILFLAVMAVATTYLGENLTSPLNITWFIVFAIYGAVYMYFLTEYEKTKGENEQLRKQQNDLERQLSLYILKSKNEGINYFDITFNPVIYQKKLTTNIAYRIQICVNSIKPVERIPDILFTTNSKWDFFDQHGNKIYPFEHNEKFVYSLKKCKISHIDNKFFIYEFKIMFKNPGVQQFSILVESRDLRTEISNEINVI